MIKTNFPNFPVFTIIPNIKRGQVLNWWKKKHWHIRQPKYVFYAQSRGVRIIYNYFRQIAVIKIVKFPPPPLKKISTYLSTLSWIHYSIFWKKNNIAFISVYTSDITVFLQYCRLCLFYNVIFIYLHCFTCLHSVLHNMPACHIIMSIYLYQPHNMSTYHPPPVQLVQPN